MPFIRSCWQQIAGSLFTNCQVAFFAKLEAIFAQKRCNHRKSQEGGKNFNLSIIPLRQVYFANLIRADNTQAVPGENTCYFSQNHFQKMVPIFACLFPTIQGTFDFEYYSRTFGGIYYFRQEQSGGGNGFYK